MHGVITIVVVIIVFVDSQLPGICMCAAKGATREIRHCS